MKKQTVKIVVTANLDYSGLIRHVANEVFEHANFSKPWCARLKLVVDELFMNAVRYGSVPDQSRVHVTFEKEEESLRCAVEDEGVGQRKTSVEELKAIIQRNGAHKDLTRTSGRGLALIAKLWTDGMEVSESEHGGIRVAFVKRKEGTEMPPPALPLETMLVLREAKAAPIFSRKVSEKADSSPGAVVEVKLSGEIDQSNLLEKVRGILEEVDSLPKGAVLQLDLEGLTYINSTFIGHLAAWHKTLEEKQGRIRLRHVSTPVREILSLVGLASVLEFED